MNSNSGSIDKTKWICASIVVMFIVFLALKLFGCIAWPWSLVTAPLWVSAWGFVSIGVVILCDIVISAAKGWYRARWPRS
jgi:hypothetical protein